MGFSFSDLRKKYFWSFNVLIIYVNFLYFENFIYVYNET